MPQKLNKAGKMQDYIPKGNGDASGEYGTSNGTNKNFTKPNVITENKSVSVEKPKKEMIHDMNRRTWYEVKKREDGKYDLLGNDGTKRTSVDEATLEKIRQSSPLNDKKTYETDDKGNITLIRLGGAKKEIPLENKANVINDDLSGKKSGYDDSDIRNMDAEEFDGVITDKEFWESTTKKYEENKPILDKMGVNIGDVKFTYNHKTKDYEDNVDEIVSKAKGNAKLTEQERKAVMSLTDKVWQDRLARQYKKTSNKKAS